MKAYYLKLTAILVCSLQFEIAIARGPFTEEGTGWNTRTLLGEAPPSPGCPQQNASPQNQRGGMFSRLMPHLSPLAQAGKAFEQGTNPCPPGQQDPKRSEHNGPMKALESFASQTGDSAVGAL